MGPVKRSSSTMSIKMAPVKRSSSTMSKKSLSIPGPSSTPGGPIDIVFSFDTTGSMYSCLNEVRQKVNDVIQRLMTDIPDMRIGVFAQGDYDDTYETKHIDFTNDVAKLCDFVKEVGSTGGGDWEECYELVLRQAREELTWRPLTQRVLVMIGDAVPHPVGASRNKYKINWEEETNKLANELGVRIYAVQALSNSKADFFYESMAKITGGRHMRLEQMDTVVDMIMAICYRERGAEYFEAYEREVRAREGKGIRNEFNKMFDDLRHDLPASSVTCTDSLSSAKCVKTATKRTAKLRAGKTTPKPRKITVHKGGVKKRIVNSIKALKTAARRVAKSDANDDHIRYTLGRRLRETVGNKGFEFEGLKWTNWEQAIIHTKDASNRKLWVPRRTGVYSVRRTKNKKPKDVKRPSVYELAVEPAAGQKLVPVYVRAIYKVNARGSWDTLLLRRPSMRRRVNSVVKNGGSVYVRKAFMESSVTHHDKAITCLYRLMKEIRNTYNYAWSTRRKVERNGIVISDKN